MGACTRFGFRLPQPPFETVLVSAWPGGLIRRKGKDHGPTRKSVGRRSADGVHPGEQRPGSERGPLHLGPRPRGPADAARPLAGGLHRVAATHDGDRNRQADHRVQLHRWRPGRPRCVRRSRVEDAVRVRSHRTPGACGGSSRATARPNDGGNLFESREPPISEFSFADLAAKFPEGEYTVRAESFDGTVLAGSATFTDDVPAPPTITSPGIADDPRGIRRNPIPRKGLAISWTASGRPWPAGRWTSQATR